MVGVDVREGIDVPNPGVLDVATPDVVEVPNPGVVEKGNPPDVGLLVVSPVAAVVLFCKGVVLAVGMEKLKVVPETVEAPGEAFFFLKLRRIERYMQWSNLELPGEDIFATTKSRVQLSSHFFICFSKRPNISTLLSVSSSSKCRLNYYSS